MLLFIPMTVRALPVGRPSANTHFSNVSYDMSKLGNPYENTESPVFQDAERSPGVYLHWSLPDCFTHGVQDEATGEVIYRLAPNRWAVTRLWTDPENRLKSKCFLLESDVLSTVPDESNVCSPTVPYIKDLQQPYRILGRSFAAGSLSAGRGAAGRADESIRLTAVSETCPFFAAYAPACQNVFGFVDRVAQDGISHTALSYVVCGWYEEHGEEEPFKSVTNLEELKSSMGLTFRSSLWPDRTLCHGSISQIIWETEHTVYHTGTPDDPEPGEIAVLPTLGVANTSAEALAATLAPDHKGTERLLHHYLSGHEYDLDHHYGFAKAGNQVHQSHFYAEPVFAVDTFQLPEQDSVQDNKERQTNADPYSMLCELRSCQRRMQTDYGVLLQKQRLVYENWYLHYYSDTKTYRSYYEQMMKTAAAEVTAQLLILSTDLSDTVRVKEKLEAVSPYPLQQENDTPFYTPVEPVFLVSQLTPQADSQPDSGPIPDTPEESTLLFCRTGEQTVTGLNLADSSSFAVVLSSQDIAPPLLLPESLSEEIRDAVKACIVETLFLTAGFAPFLAAAAYKKAGKTPSGEELEQLAHKLVWMQSSNDPHFMGVFPERRAIGTFRAAWSPLIVEWEILYYPDADLLNADPSLKNWVLEQGDYRYRHTPSVPGSTNHAYPLSGRLFISDTASRQLSALAERHFKTDSAFLEAIRQMQHLSQSFGGFNSNLLMRDPAIAMDFFSFSSKEEELIRCIRQLEPSVLTERPLFDTLFSPVRAGFLSVSRLRLIDEMGYCQDISHPSVYAGEGMLAPGLQNPVQYVMLPPRLMQPARLCTFFADASTDNDTVQESFPLKETSPICGYLAASYLDHSIMVYYPDGTYACSIRLSQTGSHIQIQNAPLLPPSPAPPTDLNPELLAFLNALKEEGAGALQDLLNLLNQMQLYIRPSSSVKNTVDYFGKPLALVRVSLKVELYGNEEGYRHNEDGGEMDPTCNASLVNLQIPVQVGQLTNPLDGVTGFFEDGDYHRFHCFPNLTTRASDYLTPDPQVSLSVVRESNPRILSLLMDPWSEVNLVTGFLPVETLRIPHKLVAEGLEHLTVTFLGAPLLCGSALKEIPIPHSDSFSYLWIQQTTRGASSRTLSYSDGDAFFSEEPLQLAEGYMTIIEKEKEEKES